MAQAKEMESLKERLAEAEAQMKGSDPDMDLAVIAVSMKDVDAVTEEAIAVAALGDSESLTVGEPAESPSATH